MPRLPVLLTDAEKRRLRDRAKAHKTSMSAYLRRAALGDGAGKSPEDAWWDSLPPSRRKQVHGWLTNPKTRELPMPGQGALPIGDDR